MTQRLWLKVGIAVLVTVIIAVVLIVVFLLPTLRFYPPEIVLDCTLPTERPVMDAPMVISFTINNTSDAQAFASSYFPEFSTVEFTNIHEGMTGSDARYYGEIGDEGIFLEGDGTLNYLIRDENDTIVSEEEFPRDAARACVTAFIESHGDMGPYEETNVSESSVYGMNGFEGITSHMFDFNRRYDGYLVLGFDGIRTIVNPDGPTVSFYVRRDHVYGGVNETRAVISAAEAWWAARNVTYIDYMEDLHITSVELCYYLPDTHESVTELHPAWRFISPHVDIFVDAFTGIAIG